MPFHPGYVGGGSRYIAQPVHFDGVEDYLSRGGGLSGAVDGKTITFSCWVRFGVLAAGTDRSIWYGATTVGGSSAVNAIWRVGSTEKLQISYEDSGGTSRLNVTSAATFAINTWYHILFSADLVTSANRGLYINDVLDASTWTTYTNNTLDFTPSDWAVCGRAAGDQLANEDVADLWFNTSYIDLSVTANRRKFISAAGKPVFLGANGELPAGSNPLVFLSGASWNTNKGAGGGFTIHGTPTPAQTSPSLGYATPAYVARPVNFDGTNDYLTRGAGLTGAADSKLATMSFWYKPANDGVQHNIFTSAQSVGGAAERYQVFRNSSNKLALIGTGTAGGTGIVATSTTSLTSGNWYHVLISYDTANSAKRWVYINDVLESMTWTSYVDNTLEMTPSDWAIGAAPSGANKLNGDLADIWFEDGVYTDFSVTANRRVFIDAIGDPINLGEWGELPIGTRPLVYQSGGLAAWSTNKGSGGGFTIHGVLNESSTSPSPGYALSGQSQGSLMELSQYYATQDSTASAILAGPLTINGVDLGYHEYSIKTGPVTVSSFNSSDWFTTTQDSVSSIIVVKGNLTINAGQVFIPPVRKLFTTVYVTGNCALNGELSMTARGANHSTTGSNITEAAIRIATGIFSSVSNPTVPAAGGGGGASQTRSTDGFTNGITGTAGTNGQTGGGGSGAVHRGSGTGITGIGAAGTSFSGGPASGGISAASASSTGEDAGIDGGAGGAGDGGGAAGHGAGGAGNPGGVILGASANPGADGTGGILVLIVEGTLSGTGTITANGSAGGSVDTGSIHEAGGGGSGGGSVTIMHGADSSAITPVAAGGAGGIALNNGGTQCNGGAGGAGTARKLQMTVSTISFLASATGGSGLTIPATAQVGDVAVFIQDSDDADGPPSIVLPSGFTLLRSDTDTGVGAGSRFTCGYKILTSGDPGLAVTGMNGDRTDAMILAVFRGDVPVNTVTPSAWQGVGGMGTSDTSFTLDIAPSSTGPIIVISGYGDPDEAGSVYNTSPALTYINTNGSACRLGYKTYNKADTLVDHTVGFQGGGTFDFLKSQTAGWLMLS